MYGFCGSCFHLESFQWKCLNWRRKVNPTFHFQYRSRRRWVDGGWLWKNAPPKARSAWMPSESDYYSPYATSLLLVLGLGITIILTWVESTLVNLDWRFNTHSPTASETLIRWIFASCRSCATCFCILCTWDDILPTRYDIFWEISATNYKKPNALTRWWKKRSRGRPRCLHTRASFACRKRARARAVPNLQLWNELNKTCGQVATEQATHAVPRITVTLFNAVIEPILWLYCYSILLYYYYLFYNALAQPEIDRALL